MSAQFQIIGDIVTVKNWISVLSGNKSTEQSVRNILLQLFYELYITNNINGKYITNLDDIRIDVNHDINRTGYFQLTSLDDSNDPEQNVFKYQLDESNPLLFFERTSIKRVDTIEQILSDVVYNPNNRPPENGQILRQHIVKPKGELKPISSNLYDVGIIIEEIFTRGYENNNNLAGDYGDSLVELLTEKNQKKLRQFGAPGNNQEWGVFGALYHPYFTAKKYGIYGLPPVNIDVVKYPQLRIFTYQNPPNDIFLENDADTIRINFEKEFVKMNADTQALVKQLELIETDVFNGIRLKAYVEDLNLIFGYDGSLYTSIIDFILNSKPEFRIQLFGDDPAAAITDTDGRSDVAVVEEESEEESEEEEKNPIIILQALVKKIKESGRTALTTVDLTHFNESNYEYSNKQIMVISNQYTPQIDGDTNLYIPNDIDAIIALINYTNGVIDDNTFVTSFYNSWVGLLDPEDTKTIAQFVYYETMNTVVKYEKFLLDDLGHPVKKAMYKKIYDQMLNFLPYATQGYIDTVYDAGYVEWYDYAITHSKTTLEDFKFDLDVILETFTDIPTYTSDIPSGEYTSMNDFNNVLLVNRINNNAQYVDENTYTTIVENFEYLKKTIVDTITNNNVIPVDNVTEGENLGDALGEISGNIKSKLKGCAEKALMFSKNTDERRQADNKDTFKECITMLSKIVIPQWLNDIFVDKDNISVFKGVGDINILKRDGGHKYRHFVLFQTWANRTWINNVWKVLVGDNMSTKQYQLMYAAYYFMINILLYPKELDNEDKVKEIVEIMTRFNKEDVAVKKLKRNLDDVLGIKRKKKKKKKKKKKEEKGVKENEKEEVEKNISAKQDYNKYIEEFNDILIELNDDIDDVNPKILLNGIQFARLAINHMSRDYERDKLFLDFFQKGTDARNRLEAFFHFDDREVVDENDDKGRPTRSKRDFIVVLLFLHLMLNIWEKDDNDVTIANNLKIVLDDDEDVDIDAFVTYVNDLTRTKFKNVYTQHDTNVAVKFFEESVKESGETANIQPVAIINTKETLGILEELYEAITSAKIPYTPDIREKSEKEIRSKEWIGEINEYVKKTLDIIHILEVTDETFKKFSTQFKRRVGLHVLDYEKDISDKLISLVPNNTPEMGQISTENMLILPVNPRNWLIRTKSWEQLRFSLLVAIQFLLRYLNPDSETTHQEKINKFNNVLKTKKGGDRSLKFRNETNIIDDSGNLTQSSLKNVGKISASVVQKDIFDIISILRTPTQFFVQYGGETNSSPSIVDVYLETNVNDVLILPIIKLYDSVVKDKETRDMLFKFLSPKDMIQLGLYHLKYQVGRNPYIVKSTGITQETYSTDMFFVGGGKTPANIQQQLEFMKRWSYFAEFLTAIKNKQLEMLTELSEKIKTPWYI